MQSAIVFSYPYFPTPENAENFPLQNLRIAAYAKNTDYHYWIKEKLQDIITSLQKLHPDQLFLAAVDSSPILERDLAARAGLGWFGKNTCLIHPKKGSLFFICEILTSLKIENKIEALPDFCGTCTKCMDICPTQALEKPKVLNANKCISYWTIESRKIPPIELRSQIGDWFFGCDLCQTICPWNQKVFKSKLSISLNTDLFLKLDAEESLQLESELRLILTSSGKALQKMFAITPLQRSGSFGLRRNALIVIANRKILSLESEVKKFLQDPKLGELAQWTLQKLYS